MDRKCGQTANAPDFREIVGSDGFTGPTAEFSLRSVLPASLCA